MESLASALRAGTDSPTPGPLLVTASMLLDIAAGDPDPSTATATLVRGLLSWNRPECSAGALAMATLSRDDALRREVRRDAADRGHLLPRWLVELNRSEAVDRAVELSTVFRDVDELVVGVTVSGGHCLTAVVHVDNELGFRVVDGRLYARHVDVVVAAIEGGEDPDVRVRDITPADARARLTDALRDPDLDALSGRSTPWRQLRPLVRWLVTVLPDGGDAVVAAAGDDVDLDDVTAAFLASPWGRPWVRSDLPELVEAVLGDGLGNGLGDPLLWAPHNVRRLLHPESIWLDHEDLDTERVPELLRDIIRYGHAERGLRPGLTDDALAAVDRHAPRYLAAVRAWHDDVA
ncbi:hypothetical protein DQ239_17390 [Blastococcus sp. TF02-09]|nr:hypothetical protein DQ239_17390 [Blastococcus sp. TF02-9]